MCPWSPTEFKRNGKKKSHTPHAPFGLQLFGKHQIKTCGPEKSALCDVTNALGPLAGQWRRTPARCWTWRQQRANCAVFQWVSSVLSERPVVSRSGRKGGKHHYPQFMEFMNSVCGCLFLFFCFKEKNGSPPSNHNAAFFGGGGWGGRLHVNWSHDPISHVG